MALRRPKLKQRNATNANRATPTTAPTPIPAFAPGLRPADDSEATDGVEDGKDVLVAVAVVDWLRVEEMREAVVDELPEDDDELAEYVDRLAGAGAKNVSSVG